MENNTCSSKSIPLLIVLLLLGTFLCRTESALPSHHELLSITGRRMMSYYKPNSAIGTPSSHSNHAPGGDGPNGRKLMSIYRPNGDIFGRPSGSEHGDGRRTPAP